MTLLTRQPELATSWLADFERHRGQHADVVLAPNPDLGTDPAGLTASLAVFQVGESGGGSRLFAAADKLGIEPDYRRALELFIGEEQEHARLLALVLGTADAPTRSSHWSDQIFIWARQLFGLRGEILMLLVAELIAL